MAGDVEGVGPAPAPTATVPTSEEAGQEGLACSSAPAFAFARPAAAIWASEHSATPASLPIRPGGRVTFEAVEFLGAVFAAQLQDEGAVGAGLGGFGAGGEARAGWAPAASVGQAPPPGLGDLEGVGRGRRRARFGRRPGGRGRSVVVGAAGGGGAQGARAPPKKSSLKSSKGSWGFSSKVVVSWPVCGSASTSPASLTTTPVSGSSTTM